MGFKLSDIIVQMSKKNLNDEDKIRFIDKKIAIIEDDELIECLKELKEEPFLSEEEVFEDVLEMGSDEMIDLIDG